MSQGIRRTIYLSPTKDADILAYIKPLMERYDFSAVMRELARDGIKYRVAPSEKLENSLILCNTSPPVNIELKRKEVTVTDEELEDRFDNF